MKHVSKKQSEPAKCLAVHQASRNIITSLKPGLPDDSVPLSVCYVSIVREQDGVIRHHRITGGQDSSPHMTHVVQNAVIHQEVIHQQLHTHRFKMKHINEKGTVISEQTEKPTPNSFTPL